MKQSIGAVVLYLQVYCPYPFSFEEADVIKHTLPKRIRKPTQPDTYYATRIYFKTSLYSHWKDKNKIIIIWHIQCYITSYN